MALARVVRKLPYYGRSAAALMRIATGPSIATCCVAHDKRLRLRHAPSLRLSATLDLLVVKETFVDDVYGLGSIHASDGLIVDVGAGIGDFTLAAAARFPDAAIWSFEPNAVAFRLLEQNIRSHACSNVHAVEVAVGTNPRYVLQGVGRGPRASAVTAPAGAGSLVVRGRRLDAAIPDGPIRLLKIDTEGLELDVLASASNVLDRVERAAVEYHRHLLPSADRLVAEFMHERGFETTIRPDPYDDSIGYVYASRSGASGAAPTRTQAARVLHTTLARMRRKASARCA